MTIFEEYADFYDLIYKDKNYSKESAFTHQLIQKFAPNTRSIIELGCGTGAHAEKLVRYGYQILGIDLSHRMLEYARKRFEKLPSAWASNLHVMEGDIRTVRMTETYDTAIALFHVMSYQTSNDDLSAAFTTVKTHLKIGGVFIFDCWYGPSVLTDRPQTRIREFSVNNELKVVRFAKPVIDFNANCVDVNYVLFVNNISAHELLEFNETHTMRYLFIPEVRMLAKRSGFSVLVSGEWMTNKNPDVDTWSVYFVLRRES